MRRVNLDRDWEFYEANEANGFVFQVVEGEKTDLPHDFILGKKRCADAPGGPGNGYFGEGQGNYKKTLDILAEWKEDTVLLDVDGAYMNLEVVLNGEVLGIHPYGYTPYQVDLTPALRFDGRKNKLKLSVQSRQPSSRWYSGGGLYRDVCLWVGNPVHIRPWDVFVTTPEVSEKTALVQMDVTVTTPKEGTWTLLCRVLDANGAETASARQEISGNGKVKSSVQLQVDEPHLWDTDTPYLYTYEVSVLDQDTVLDTAKDTFGIRTIAVDAQNGFRLNGKQINLKGGCLHHDNGLLGAAAYPKAEERKIRLLKEAGYNAVRISHYPPSLAMLQVCDRLGMLLLDELTDVWRVSKVPMDYHLYFEDWWERDMEYMILRDRNHPCVITYSIGNEIPERDGSNHGAEWSAKLAKKVRSMDPTRFVLSAICGLFPDMEDDELHAVGGNFEANLANDDERWTNDTAAYAEPLDIVGYNYLPHLYEPTHERFPNRVMCGTETHAFTTYDYWKKVEDLPYVIGDFIWACVDYLGEVGVGKVYWESAHEDFNFMTPYPWRSSWQSDIDLTGEYRPQSIYRQIMWGNTALSGIFTTHPKHYKENFTGTQWHWYDVNDSWTFTDEWLGKPVKVDVYGAGDEAEFILNGRSLGRVPFEKLIATMDIDYEPGSLEGIIYKEGKEISRCRIFTTGAPCRLEMVPEEDSYAADGKDLMYVRINICDADGNRVMDDETEITVDIEGVGEFVSLGSANPCTEDQLLAPVCHLYRGSAVLILKSSTAGETKITVSADGMKDADIVVTAK